MYLLAIAEKCSDPVMIYVLGIFKRILSIIQLVGPLVGLVSIGLNLFKLMINPDDKKNKSLITNWLIAMLMLFLVPVAINVVMQLLDGSFKISSCWNSAFILFNSLR